MLLYITVYRILINILILNSL